MKLGLLARQVAECLFIILGVAVVVYLLVYPFGVAHNVNLLAGYYTGILSAGFVVVWVYFGVPWILGAQCKNCRSKSVFMSFFKGFFCGNCGGNSFAKIVKTETMSDDDKMVWLINRVMIVPFSVLGICGLLGSVLAGITLNLSLMSYAILLSAFFPSFMASLTVLLKFFLKSKYFQEHKQLGITLFIIILIVLMILMLLVYSAILHYLLHWLGIFP